jgi:2-polyprenyl-6-methoxyphenol hydroxylase-like FAD-dependent oxidoreductase
MLVGGGFMQGMTPLIVGAGPVGLGAAFLLRRAGIATRIVDQAVQPAAESKALAVNPRTLELLESSGITQEMLGIGIRAVGVRIQFDAKRSAQIPLDSLQHKYPFMLALSQATTEHLLGAGLKAAGGNVERGTELLRCWNNGDFVEAELKHGETTEIVQCSWLLAADGAHSAARKSLNIPFNGDSFEKPWHLADIPLKTGLEENLAHVFFRDHGQFMFMIRVVDEHSEQSGGPKLWRIFSNSPDLTKDVPESIPAGAPAWSSEFKISHRINEHMAAGKVYFAGDAAHIHSPLGARGMNLGLEDAWVFSRLVQADRLQDYERLRMPCDHSVVKRVEFFSRMVLNQSSVTRLLRSFFLTSMAKTPFIRNKFLAAVTGLDHQVDIERI